MSTIDSSNSLNTILDKLGIQQPAEDAGASDKLGQADFLKLMTTQLQNQDPFQPGLHRYQARDPWRRTPFQSA